MILHILLSAWYACGIQPIVIDSISGRPTTHTAIDSLAIVSPLAIPGYKSGHTPVEVTFEQIVFDTATSTIFLRGLVSDQREKVEIPGARVVLGSLDSTKTSGPVFIPRVSVMTNYQGQFKLTARLTQKDILVVIWLGNAEKVIRLKDLLKKP